MQSESQGRASWPVLGCPKLGCLLVKEVVLVYVGRIAPGLARGMLVQCATTQEANTLDSAAVACRGLVR
jgi:hypothetical protein